MNIQLLTPKFNKNSINNTRITGSAGAPAVLYELPADTVCFTGRNKAVNTIAEHLESRIAADSPRLNRLAVTFLDILESVSFRLQEAGFSFDRVYCELHPVKSPKSYVSKITRSGSFNVPDSVRATLYCNNSYDLNNINLLLAEMKKRGYVLSSAEMSVKDLMKRGYIPSAEEAKHPEKLKIVPDIDIRLDDVSDQLTKLPPELKFSVGRPQKSGYEDIQMRFIRDFDKKKNPVQHELIILFGPNYSMAKHNEYKDVYEHLRMLDELHMEFPYAAAGSNSAKANRYIELIKQMFRGKVSQKLFQNGKNKDLYDIHDEAPVIFSDTDIVLFNNYFQGLRSHLAACYSDAGKTAYADSIRRQLGKDKREDIALIDNIQKELRKTIEKYNYQADLKKS